ncbi:VOC family protein [Chitinophaga solisilvae]|uniref:VOC family protein n=1 Tax=Chitinophaga solisilvae TaxID=1233460 RepID=A0A433WMH5_9BACT|nr:VOC family protein [Chitinophaga solisilvae]NSL86373.1 VOC family protein [Chitinophaga solisilvae]
MKKITPFLWFNGKVEEAMNFYTAVFQDASVLNVIRAGDQVVSATFRLEDQEFIALNGGPEFSFTPAVSFFVNCITQEEVDHLWNTLSAGGRQDRCGWLADKYGLSWQIVPTILGQLLSDPDRGRAQRVMQAMMGMTKIDIAALQRAYNGE